MREKGWASLRDREPTRLLVLGRSGQLAVALARIARPGVTIACAGRPDLDIADPASVAAAIARHAPHAIVNAAAFTAVDRAETCPDEAMAVNGKGAGIVAAAAARAGLPIVHLSTDYVYSGEKSAPYVETDPVAPLNVYGQTKLAGEIAVAAANPDHVIVRTGWLFAPWGQNFARTMMRLAAERDRVRVVDDQFGTPTFVPHLAAVLVDIALAILADDAPGRRGVFHVAAAGRASWADFAGRLFAVSEAMGGAHARVDRISTADYPTPARRPAFSVLSTAKLQNAFGLDLPDWRDGADAFVRAHLGEVSKPRPDDRMPDRRQECSTV